MQFESSQLYRVKAVAEALDVSPATVYRAIESGALAAYKLGTGKGTLRVQGAAVTAYLAQCGSTAATPPAKPACASRAATAIF